MLTFLVTGCGSIGKRHLRNLLAEHNARVIAHDPRVEAREEVARELGIKAYAAYDSALAHGVDVVLVCNPTSLHVPYALTAVQAGCHVFIEKPLAHDRIGWTELLVASEAQNRVVFVACNFRFDPGLQHVRELVAKGVLGRVFHATAQFGHYLPCWRPQQDYRASYSVQTKLGGGILLDAYHEFDYLYWILGPADEVFCHARRSGLLEGDTEDVAMVSLKYQNGSLAHIALDYLRRPYQRTLLLAGEHGTIEWDFSSQTVRRFHPAGDRWETEKFTETLDTNRMYVQELRHFLACLEGREPACSGLLQAMHVNSVILAAKDSARTGQAVRIEAREATTPGGVNKQAAIVSSPRKGNKRTQAKA